ncbi:hypothetical protein DFP72DRAFT_745881, partial [Ephemerocybe angulata]
MKFSLALAALLPLAASAADIAVSVGKSGLTFDPTSVKAAAGDVITFSFFPKNHTVTQSTFDKPCEPSANGASSGFTPVASADTPTLWKWTVVDTNPAWFYCAQTAPANHCTSGMVFAVNPTADKTVAAFTEKAKSGNGTTTSSTTAAPSGSSTATGYG